ncbi:MAG TPA: hypothetical protein VGY30_01835 [Solirubrobacteraceae bacterium]|jgi:preprotein translocase subunit Sec61beta|nr:hypothetical protein [Solirubrobacteraceae bacterium]
MSVRSIAAAVALQDLDGQAALSKDPIQWLEEYVPSEAVIGFVATMAFTGSWSVLGRWAIVALFGLLVGFLIAHDPFGERGRNAGPKIAVYQTVAGLLAYLAWTLLDPHNPISLDPRIGVGIAVFVSIMLSALARSRPVRNLVKQHRRPATSRAVS